MLTFRKWISVFFLLFLGAACSMPALAAQRKDYMVVVDITAVTQKPGQRYVKTAHSIEYSENVKDAPIYGNILQVEPQKDGRYGKVFTEEGALGFIEMKKLTALPQYSPFQPEPFRFKASGVKLYLQPGLKDITSFTPAGDQPYRVIAGEVTEGIGSFTDKKGVEWILLRFSTSNGAGIGMRHAWAKASDLTRLSAYEPDYSAVAPSLVPKEIRNLGAVPAPILARIAKEGFAVGAPADLDNFMDDMVSAYESLSSETPIFVTSDLFLHSFHLIFSRSLKKVEAINFAPMTKAMLFGALDRLEAMEKKYAQDEALLPVFARVRDFLTVPALLIDPEAQVAASETAKEELKLVLNGQGMHASKISGTTEDYSFYKPRGHYTASEALSNYFRSMAYLGGMSLRLGKTPEEGKANVAAIALLCAIFDGDEKLRGQWEALYRPLAYMVGEADDPSILQYGPLTRKVLDGKLEGLKDPEMLSRLHADFLAAAPAPAIIDAKASRLNMTQEERADEAAGFRLMGRRFVLDAWIFSQLTSPGVGAPEAPRNLPQAEDVMAALGSSVAEAAVEGAKKNVPGYAEALVRVKGEVKKFFAAESKTVYTDWLKTLAALLSDRGSKQFFANSEAWLVKTLTTAMSSWAELKHDTVLYAKQSYAEMGGGGEWAAEPFGKPKPRGYVEPVPQFFSSMGAALDRLLGIFKTYSLGDSGDNSGPDLISKIESFREYVDSYGAIAAKEVSGEPLNDDDYDAIERIASFLNAELLLDTALIESEEDLKLLRMPLVTDVATDGNAGVVLHIATGRPHRVFVFVDDKLGGPRLTVGFIYSFYEFERSLSEGRMTDEEWRAKVYDDKAQKELDGLTPQWSKKMYVK